jgi:hypothetical protein
MLHRLYTIDYGSCHAGSKAANDKDEYHPLFYLDYISIVGRPLKAITRASERFFDNVTVTFKDWQMPYTGKHQYKLPFDLENRTFRLASAATREIWFIVMHPIVAPAIELLSRRERLKKQAQSARLSGLQHHHAEALASYIKEVFLSGGFTGERVEPSWTLNSPLSQKLTCNKWTMFQERFMEDWPQHVARHSYDIFWTQNQPAFHAYDYGANIEITVSDRLQSLEKEVRLRPDDDPAEDSDDESDSDSESGSMHPAREDDAGPPASQTQPHAADDWPLDLDSSPNAPDSLYSDGLRELSTELDQKYDLNSISCMSYALAVDLHCLDSSSADPDRRTAFCMLADRNAVQRQYGSASGLTFYPMAFHSAYGNFTSAGPPRFLKDHVLAVMKDNMSFQNDGADVLSCDYFQAYSNIKRSLRYNPEDLLVTQGIATAALTLPTTDAQQSASVKAKQQHLLQRLQGDATPEDPDASRPFARERQRIQHAVAEEEFAYRMEQVVNIDVERLIPQRRNLRTILQPIFQLMRFYLQETQHYTPLLRCFRPNIFPRILGSFARVFELAIDEMLVRFRAQGSNGLGLALSEGVAALDRLGHYCFTGSLKALIGSVLKPLKTMDILRRGAWPFIDPQMLDLRHGEGSMDIQQWPRAKDGRPIFMHVASLSHHYGPEVAASRHSLAWFRDLGGKTIGGPADATRFLKDLFRDLWIPQMVAFVRHQLRRRMGKASSAALWQSQRSLIDNWAGSSHPFSWRYDPYISCSLYAIVASMFG